MDAKTAERELRFAAHSTTIANKTCQIVSLTSSQSAVPTYVHRY